LACLNGDFCKQGKPPKLPIKWARVEEDIPRAIATAVIRKVNILRVEDSRFRSSSSFSFFFCFVFLIQALTPEILREGFFTQST
jgi:hypothetical protein